MAIAVVNGTPVGASGGVNVNAITVAAPTLSATDVHVIAATVNATGGVLFTPTGYSVMGSQALVNTATAAPSSSSTLYVFYRQGAAAANSAVSIAVNPGTTVGRLSAVPFTLTGIDATTPFEGVVTTNTTLSAPTKTASTADLLVTAYGVREESLAPLGTNAGTITASATMTRVATQSSLLTNNATAAVTMAATKAITSGATGAQLATTNLAAGTSTTARLDGSMSFLVNAGAGGPTAPNAPSITVTAGDTQNVVTWTAPPDGGSAITSYNLQRSTASDMSAPTNIPSLNGIASGAVSYTDTGRTNGTTSYYHLLATNAVGSSSYSTTQSGTPVAASATGYVAVVMATNPAHYYSLNGNYTTQDIGNAATLVDWITDPGSGITGPPTFGSQTGFGATPAIDCAKFTTGKGLILATNSQDFSVTKTKEMTVMLHIAIDDYDTSAGNAVGSNDRYTHPIHKSESGVHEWTTRYYQDESGADNGGRPRRHSGYYYNPAGGIGNGSYAQPDVAGSVDGTNMTNVGSTNGVAETNRGIEHVVIVQYWTTGTGSFPGGIKIFFNGVQTDTDTMTGGGNIVPTFTSQKVRLGRNDAHTSWVVGRVRRVGFWNRLLTNTEIGTLTNSTNRALTEGIKGSAASDTPPTQPLNLSGVRSAATPANATVTWTTPNSDGGQPITNYVLTSDNGGVGTPQTFTVGPTVHTQALTGLPNVQIGLSIIARNSVGDSSPTTSTISAFSTLPLLGSVSDNFNTTADPNRIFDAGVVQANGELEWTIVDSTRRATYVRGNMTAQRVFMKVTPSNATNDVTALFVRSTADPTLQLRIAFQNGVLSARDAQTGAPVVTSRAFNQSNDVYWSMIDTGSAVLMQTSPDGVNWTTLAHPTIPTPAWIGDTQVGVEAYNAVSV